MIVFHFYHCYFHIHYNHYNYCFKHATYSYWFVTIFFFIISDIANCRVIFLLFYKIYLIYLIMFPIFLIFFTPWTFYYPYTLWKKLIDLKKNKIKYTTLLSEALEITTVNTIHVILSNTEILWIMQIIIKLTYSIKK